MTNIDRSMLYHLSNKIDRRSGLFCPFVTLSKSGGRYKKQKAISGETAF